MVHFIGIKGSGMSALAQIMHNLGYKVQGSDVDKEFFTEIGLKANGIPVLVYDSEHIKEGFEVVLGNSIKEDNPEYKRALELNLKIYSYQEMISKLCENYNTIAITGCHGKTTTTAILSHVLNNTVGCNYLIGDGTGHATKDNQYFVLEACEYKRHFLSYFPNYSIITNIELDHVDYYKSLEDVLNAYQEFITQTKNKVIACGDDENVRKLECDKIIYYGFNDNNNVQARNVIYSQSGTSFEVYIDDKLYSRFELPCFGEHLILNTLAVITICYLENLPLDKVADQLKTFPGAKRRFSEEKINETIFVDDYAHHPTEIKVTIKAAKQKYPDKEIVAIYQPHTFTRTSKFIKEYADTLGIADEVFILPIHPAREKQEDYPGITSQKIIEQLGKGSVLEMTDANLLVPHKDKVLLFMSANDLSVLRDETKKLMN